MPRLLKPIMLSLKENINYLLIDSANNTKQSLVKH